MLHIPASRAAMCLGLLGLAPFIVLAACLWLVAPIWQTVFADILRDYGAVVLGFLGAVHWGVALAAGERPADVWRYAYGVCPALLGWVAMSSPPGPGLFLVFWGLVASFIVDRRVFAHIEWYVTLRAALTILASLSLFAAYKAL